MGSEMRERFLFGFLIIIITFFSFGFRSTGDNSHTTSEVETPANGLHPISLVNQPFLPSPLHLCLGLQSPLVLRPHWIPSLITLEIAVHTRRVHGRGPSERW